MRDYFKAIIVIIILVFISSFGFGAVFGYGGGGGGRDDDFDDLTIICYTYRDVEYCNGGIVFPLELTATTSDSCGGLIHLDWESYITHMVVNYDVNVVYYIYKNDVLIFQTKETSTDIIGSSLDIFTVEGTSVITPMSNPASATPSLPCLSQTPVLSAMTSYSCGGKIVISWPSIFGAIKYKVYKNGALLMTTSETSHTISASKSDIFVAKAVFSYGDSEVSNSVFALPSGSCDCLGSIPDTDDFAPCPNTFIDKGGSWKLVSQCPAIMFGNCQYYRIDEITKIIDKEKGETEETDETDKTGGGKNNIIEKGIISFVTISTTTEKIIEGARDFIISPVGSITSKVISTTGIVGGGVATAAVALNIDLLSLPFKLWGLLLSIFGLSKRNRPWGTVYDSVTKQPIDPAYVILKNLQTNEELMSITDLDGRYGFLVSPGSYVLSANKTNYSFPSKKIAGQTSDVLYDNLYFGEELRLDEKNTLINKNIPLDPIKFDWNEFVKGKKNLMKFYSRREKIIKITTDWFFRFGFVVSLISLFLAPAPYNSIIFGLYILLIILRKFGLKQRALGSLVEQDGNPLSFAIVRIMDASLNIEIAHKVADKIGRYYCLVPKGKYFVKIEKKNDDESYSLVRTSEEFEAPNGIINRNFII